MAANDICYRKLDYLIDRIQQYIDYLKFEGQLTDTNVKWGITGTIANAMSNGMVGTTEVRPGYDWDDIKAAFIEKHWENYMYAIDFAKKCLECEDL